MIDRRACAVVSMVALAPVGCARRTDAETRAAFEAAARGGSDTGTSKRARPGRRPRRSAPDAPTTWQAVANVFEASIQLMASEMNASKFTAAATAWCAVTPEPRATDAGPLYVCFPREPLQLGKRTFTLEISASGVIGLNMDELDDATSRTIVEQARAAVARLCATPFTVAPTENEELGAFWACPVDGGATLAVGRARSGAGPGWFVAVTVLGERRGEPPP